MNKVILIELPEVVMKKLNDYGYDFKRNAEEQAMDVWKQLEYCERYKEDD